MTKALAAAAERLPAADRALVETAINWLRQYCEPWLCPRCQNNVKVPDSDSDPRWCSRCGGKDMFPYAYLEVERMNKQMRMLLLCATHYSAKANGHYAREILAQLSEVRVTGRVKPSQQSLWSRLRSRLWR